MPNVMTNQVRGGAIIPVPTVRGSRAMTNAPLTVTAPISTSLCVVVLRDESPSEAPSGVTWGAVNMTQFAAQSGSNIGLYFWAATGCTGTSVTATYATYTADLDIVAIEIVGALTASFTDGAHGAAPNSTTLAPGSYTLTQDGALSLVAASTGPLNTRSITATPAGYTQLARLGTTSQFDLYVGYKLVSPAGAENPACTTNVASAFEAALGAGVKHG